MRPGGILLPFLLVLGGALGTSGAVAQPRPVLVLPVTVGADDPAAAAAAAQTMTAAISSGEARALGLEQARARFEEVASTEPPSISDSDIDRWLELSRQAVRQLAHTDYAAARQSLLEAQALSERAAAELNRELTRASQVLDTCLYEVRAYLETNDPRAEARAAECRRLVPRVAPSPYQHPPEVVELLGRIDARIAESPPGSLRIESQPSGCAVRLNGVEFGATPFVSEELATGSYRVQVECEEGRRGRVHVLQLSEGAAVVRIDTRFDAAVRSDTVVRLVYPDAEGAARRFGDALSVASVVGAAEVWLLASEGEGVFRVDRIDAGARRVAASVRVPSSALTPAITALLAGRSEDQTGETAVAMAPWAPSASVGDPAPARRAAPGDRTAADMAGIAIGAAGLGAWVAAWGLYGWRLDGGGRLVVAAPSDVDYLARQGAWLDRRYAIWATAGAAGALGVAALALLLPDAEGTPWWAWLLGGAGLLLDVLGAVEIATASPCPLSVEQEQACVDAGAAIDRGAIWISTSAPLLAVPLVYLVRAAVGPGATASLEAGPGRVALRIGGTLGW